MSYQNLDVTVRPRFDRFLKWAVVDRVSGRRRKAPRRAPVATTDTAFDGHDAVHWLGHSTCLMELGGVRILTDPVFAPRLGGVITRNVPVVLDVPAFPALDVVAISHNHRDHLDRPTIRAIEARWSPVYCVPVGVDRYLRAWRIPDDRIRPLNWWETTALPELEIELTFVPAQHWSQRTPFDRNKSLWGGWLVRAGGRCAYFAGDTGWFDGFTEIGRRFTDIDVAMIPIGAYDPEWFMSPQHIGPEDAGRALLEVRAPKMLPIHWGTYKLTDEPLDEPPLRLERWRQSQGLPPDAVAALAVGGRIALDPAL